MERHLLTNAMLVLPRQTRPGSLLIEDALIADVMPDRHYPDGIDLGGQYLSPGVIDIHTDYLEKELHPRPDTPFPPELAFHMMDLRAIGCGVTTVLGAARVSEDTGGPLGTWTGSGIHLIEIYAKLRQSALGRHLVHVRWDPNFEPASPPLDKIESLRDVIGNLVYNDSTPGERQFKNTFADQIKRWAVMKGVTIAEATAFFEERRRKALAVNNRSQVYARLGGLLPLGSHDDTTIEHVLEAHAAGATLTEMPVTIDAARQAKALGMQVCMGAPNYYRGGSHCGNLSCEEAMAANLVDMLCSDYHFPSLLGSAVRMMGRGMAAHDALRLMTANPARHLGRDRELGTIETGKKADVIAFEAMKDFAFVTNVWVDGARKLIAGDGSALALRAASRTAEAVS